MKHRGVQAIGKRRGTIVGEGLRKEDENIRGEEAATEGFMSV